MRLASKSGVPHFDTIDSVLQARPSNVRID
jgi:hypothetical protein